MIPRVDNSIDRRAFLYSSAAACATACLAWHVASPLRAADPASRAPLPGTSPAHEPRFHSLRLLTAAPLDSMRAFYKDLLGLSVLEQSETSLTIAAGLTPITFIKAQPDQGGPWYHVAFNIPENKLFLARQWQLERTPLRRQPNQNSALAGYPDIADFRHWNAHSVFFWDPAHNLLEYIARHDLKNSAPGPFTPDDILYASEIGLVSNDVLKTSADVRSAINWNLFRGASESFQPIGDDRGLIIIFPTGRDWGSSDNIRRTTQIYPTRVRISSGPELSFKTPDHPHEILSQP